MIRTTIKKENLNHKELLSVTKINFIDLTSALCPSVSLFIIICQKFTWRDRLLLKKNTKVISFSNGSLAHFLAYIPVLQRL